VGIEGFGAFVLVAFDDGRFANAISAISSSNVCFRYSSA